MQTLILQAVQALYTNGGGRPSSYKGSVRRSTRLSPGSRGSAGGALYGMRPYMNVGRGYGGVYSPGGSGYGSPTFWYGSSPSKRKKPKKRPYKITQPKRNPKMNKPRKSTYKGRPDRPRLNRPIKGRRNQRLTS